MKYRAIEDFNDRQLSRMIHAGEEYPPRGASVPDWWIEKLMTEDNKCTRTFLEVVEDDEMADAGQKDGDAAGDRLLKEIRIGALELEEVPTPDGDTYAVKTQNKSNIVAVEADGEIEILVNDEPHRNGESATWKDGENTVEVLVGKSDYTEDYFVMVVKE